MVIATAHWIDACICSQTMHDISSNIIYQPLVSNVGIPDMNKLTICVTQFVGNERYDLTFLVQAAGAQYSGTLQSGTSLLIYKKY